MRQRIKMASALVHDPAVLLLDEPFNGMDPRQRLHLTALLRELAQAGRTVLFSSHILEEVEQLADGIQVVVSGRHAASGDYRQIRRLMTERPHQYTIRSSDDRSLAAAVVATGLAVGVRLAGTGTAAAGTPAPEPELQVEVADYGRFIAALPALARDRGVRLYEVLPTDESLERVFAYLMA